MSFQLQTWAVEQTTGSPTRKAVLLCLANVASHHTGRCDPGVEYICHETELGRTAVKAALSELEATGLIKRRRQRRSDGSLSTYSYTFPKAPPGSRGDPGLRSAGDPTPGSRGDPQNLEVLEPELLRASPNGEARALSAQAIVSDVVDRFAAIDIVVPPRHRGMIAKQAKELLDAGMSYELVLLASATAERRGEPQNLHFIANDIQQAKAGTRLTRKQYERELQDAVEREQFEQIRRTRGNR